MLFRKIATILLLTFLLFNWVGYWLFLSWFESREAARLETRIDNAQYSADQLILLKVSAAVVPYSNPSAIFEPVSGEVKIGDIHYRYVRKRLYNDSIEFLCIPEKESRQLQSARNDIFRLVTDVPDNSGHGKTSPAGKASQLLKAFWQQIPTVSLCNFPAAGIIPSKQQEASLRQGHTRIGKQPPRPALPLSV